MAKRGVGYKSQPGVTPASSNWMHSTDFRAMLRQVFAKNPAWFRRRDPSHNPAEWDGKPTPAEGTLAHRTRDRELYLEVKRLGTVMAGGEPAAVSTPKNPGLGRTRWDRPDWEGYVENNPDDLSEEILRQIRSELDEAFPIDDEDDKDLLDEEDEEDEEDEDAGADRPDRPPRPVRTTVVKRSKKQIRDRLGRDNFRWLMGDDDY